MGGDQDAIGFGVASSHAPSKLVELGEAEAFGVLDDHEGCPGHVHAYLDDGGGAEDVNFSGGEGSHDHLLVLPLHLPVEQTYPQVGKDFGLQGLGVGGHCFQVLTALLPFLHSGTDHIHLVPLLDLLAHETVHPLPEGFPHQEGVHVLASWRAFVDDGHFQVTI